MNLFLIKKYSQSLVRLTIPYLHILLQNDLMYLRHRGQISFGFCTLLNSSPVFKYPKLTLKSYKKKKVKEFYDEESGG